MTGSGWAAELAALVLEGNAAGARALTGTVVAAGVAPEEILDHGLVPAMAEAGRRFEDQRFFLPELMFAARAMKEALSLLQPMLAERDVPPVGRVVIGTVRGDLHDIGKNIVAAMLEGGGFAVHDLGTNVSPAAFAEGVREHGADIVGLSALLTTTMPVMKDVVDELVRTGLRERVRVLVGGAPLTEAFAEEIGADGYASSAARAVSTARDLLPGRAGNAGRTAAGKETTPPAVRADSRPASITGRADVQPATAPEEPDRRTASTVERGDAPPAPVAGRLDTQPESMQDAPGEPTPSIRAAGRSSRAGSPSAFPVAASQMQSGAVAPGSRPPTVDGTSPRELVRQTLEFRGPERIPRQLWTLPWAAKRFPQELRAIERDFPQDITTIPIRCSEPVPGGGNAHAVGTFIDAWGCRFENLQEGIIGQVKEARLSDWSAAGEVPFPQERLEIDRAAVTEFCSGTEQFVLAGTCPRPFERLQFLRGSEELYLDLNRPPAALLDFLQRLHAFYMEELTIWTETEVDALTFMDDWGSQQALLVAPELWRDLFKPLYADYVAIAHEHGKHAFMHSDGHITEIIPDLIEIGLDALNSQVFCMGVEELGDRFAGALTFWGELDRQQLLPRASTTEIAEATRTMRAALHRKGGLIAQCEFGPGARPENIRAFFETMSS